MRTTILRYAANAGFVVMLALAGNELAQYCAPQDESTDAHKFYCRSEV